VKGKVSLGSPIGDRISWAEECSGALREVLTEDTEISSLLHDLSEAISDSRREMASTGIVEACRECEEEEGGSCCGAGLEDKYDGVLLLINLLLGVELPQRRHDAGSCLFLGEVGCLLKARHVICVNYLCGKAMDRADSSKLKGLREREGRELEILFRLHERIGRILAAAGTRRSPLSSDV
jgi:hypothetical protein